MGTLRVEDADPNGTEEQAMSARLKMMGLVVTLVRHQFVGRMPSGLTYVASVVAAIVEAVVRRRLERFDWEVELRVESLRLMSYCRKKSESIIVIT